MSYILIKNGSYRNHPIQNTIFPVIQNFKKTDKTGTFITVNGSEVFGSNRGKIRVKCNPDEATFVEKSLYDKQINATIDITEAAAAKKPKPSVASDNKRMKEIEERFEILEEMTGALKSGNIRALIVTGPPGVGKSYGVEKVLEEQSLFEDIGGKSRKFEVVKGAMTALGLYCKLFRFAEAGSVLVFDDCDTVFFDDLSLNILKAALDSGKKRRICWNADSSKLAQEGIPDSFNFEGSICFITNLKFEHIKSKKLQDHLAALQSRCHYLDLTLDTMRDKLLRIKQIARKGDLFQGYKFSKKDEKEVLDFMYKNKNKFREVSLRMALKIGDLKKISKKWKALAENTCMKRN